MGLVIGVPIAGCCCCIIIAIIIYNVCIKKKKVENPPQQMVMMTPMGQPQVNNTYDPMMGQNMTTQGPNQYPGMMQ